MAALTDMENFNPFSSLQKGSSVLLNVFQRADFNGDGVLSRDEFFNFFWDGILTESELEDVFEEFNSHNTGTIDAGELCYGLLRHLGPFSQILAALEELSSTVSETLRKLQEKYDGSTWKGQFASRFLLRETQHQVTLVSQLVEKTAAKLEEDCISVIDREYPPIKNDRKPRVCPTVRPPVRLKKQMVTQTSLHLEDTSHDLTAQVRKLERLVHQLENQPRLKKVAEAEMEETENKLLFLVQQSFPVEDSNIDEFRKYLQSYAEFTRSTKGSRNVCVRWFEEDSSYVVYEIWDSEDSWIKHLKTETYRSLQHHCVDHLRKLAYFNSMELPVAFIFNKENAESI
ncbi:N-terminal EF-hand calcium-binding protein 1-like isoform X2 [Limulus polyphemus]|uniref:N-terminal EF-hand calcium-binding protein 1-like isoform X2 n=1 Tax=Limulus polyphemus TaxID=6850 RepID=A0ABM1TDL5_LIMPO|nr:N-terminal EF-hand calcium-binding protein 1-like isoform X2 [Limulus polyphemus]